MVRLHGIPDSIISNGDKVFLSQFWRELFQLQGMVLKHSTTYHPQTDGEIVVVNRCVETYLRRFVRVLQNGGINGLIRWSISIIPISILQQKLNLLKCCMKEICHIYFIKVTKPLWVGRLRSTWQSGTVFCKN